MKWYEAAGIGAVMGCLCGVVLWASVLTRDAYFKAIDEMSLRPVLDLTPGSLQWNAPVVEVYNHTRLLTPDPNMVYMPYVVTGLVMLIAFTVLFSVPLWYPYAEKMLFDIVNRDNDDEDEK